MSDEKTTTQQTQSSPKTDMLDAQYKSIGIPALAGAVTAMKAPKVKMPDKEQMS